ncbi:hypothetical protein ACV22V_12020 [Burkholderia sp. AW33-5]
MTGLVGNGWNAGHCTGGAVATCVAGRGRNAFPRDADVRARVVRPPCALPVADSMRAARVSGRTAKLGRLSGFRKPSDN